MSILYSTVIKSQVLEKINIKPLTITICKTEFTENICLKITRPDVRLLRYDDFGKAMAAFVAMPETRQIAQPKNSISQI